MLLGLPECEIQQATQNIFPQSQSITIARIEKIFIHHSSKPQDPSTLGIFWLMVISQLHNIIRLGVEKDLLMGVWFYSMSDDKILNLLYNGFF
jgi:hypothetical protein